MMRAIYHNSAGTRRQPKFTFQPKSPMCPKFPTMAIEARGAYNQWRRKDRMRHFRQGHAIMPPVVSNHRRTEL